MLILILFSRSHKSLDCWKMACPHPIPEWMDPIFKVTQGIRLLENGLSATYLSWRNGWILTKPVHLYRCDMEKNWLILVTMTPFSRSHEGLCSKMACLHLISWRNGWILTKLAKPYCCDMEKNWLDFGDQDPIFKVTGWLRLLENGLSAPYLLNEWVEFDQTCTAILLRQGQELIRVWWPLPHFQGHTRA